MKHIFAPVAIGLAAVIAGCGGSNADTVSNNLGKEAEKFKVVRSIVGDMVILCVEPGLGDAFVEGLMESIGNDPTAVIDPT